MTFGLRERATIWLDLHLWPCLFATLDSYTSQLLTIQTVCNATFRLFTPYVILHSYHNFMWFFLLFFSLLLCRERYNVCFSPLDSGPTSRRFCAQHSVHRAHLTALSIASRLVILSCFKDEKDNGHFSKWRIDKHDGLHFGGQTSEWKRNQIRQTCFGTKLRSFFPSFMKSDKSSQLNSR